MQEALNHILRKQQTSSVASIVCQRKFGVPRYTTGMTFALPILRLRLPVVAGLTILLHYLALVWVGGRIGMPQRAEAAPEPVTILAQLRAPEPVAKVAPPQPANPKPKRAPRPRPDPVQAPAEPAEAVADVGAEAGEPPIPALPLDVVAAPVDATAAADAPPSDAEQKAPLPRDLAAIVPPSSEMALELERVDANGTRWHGVAQMDWQVGGGKYAVKFDAGISMLVTKVNLLALASEGEVSEAGFAPLKATEKRRGKSLTATHFDAGQGRITFSAIPEAAPMPKGAQDKATLPLQLAAIARADPSQFDGGIDITVGEERGTSVYHFMVVGRETIDTGLGRLEALRLARPPKPGSYNSRLDVWLAPARGWYPVRIRNTEASGAVTTQTVTKIVVRESGTAHEQ